MTHTVRDHDGMKVLVVSDMDRRFDEDGKLVSKKDMANVELVHATEIAKYYGIALRTMGKGDNEVPGVWAMVHSNEFGQRVPYNDETRTRIGNRNVRVEKVIKDPATGKPASSKEEIKQYETHHKPNGQPEKGFPLVEELDDGMYVKLADLIEYADAQGWKKGGGRPGTGATKAHSDDTNSKLDKLLETVQALVQMQAAQLVTSHPAKK